MKKQTFIKTNWIVAVAVIVISVVTLAACNLPGSEKPLGGIRLNKPSKL